jgi:hypothetical protein
MNPGVRLLVVSHDAGGAEVVSAWVRRHPEYACTFLLAGPARSIFQRKTPGLEVATEEAVLSAAPEFDLVLTGTGWGSDLEKRAIAWAKPRGVRVASYLDHWVNYRERFILDGTLVLPDEIWAGDRYAYDLAGKIFPDCQVRLEPNLYFEEIREELHRHSAPPDPGRAKIRILYVCEPTSETAREKHGDPRYWGYTEFEALDGYLQYMRDQATIIDRIRIRPHPAEPPGKYRSLLDRYRHTYDVEESQNCLLVADCAWADWIVGCQSMAMVVGVLAHKQVFSCIPAGGAPAALPFPEIVALFGAGDTWRSSNDQ